jgi:hypothetical protein
MPLFPGMTQVGVGVGRGVIVGRGVMVGRGVIVGRGVNVGIDVDVGLRVSVGRGVRQLTPLFPQGVGDGRIVGVGEGKTTGVFVGGMVVEVGTPVLVGGMGVEETVGVGRGVLTTVDVAVVGETEGKRVGSVGVPVGSTFVLVAVSVGVG